MREGKPFPQAIANAPNLWPECELYYLAFADLGSCRYFEGGQIPWVAVREYCDEHGLDEDQRQTLFEVISVVDIWFLEFVEARADKADRRNKSRGKRGKDVQAQDKGKGPRRSR